MLHIAFLFWLLAKKNIMDLSSFRSLVHNTISLISPSLVNVNHFVKTRPSGLCKGFWFNINKGAFSNVWGLFLPCGSAVVGV